MKKTKLFLIGLIFILTFFVAFNQAKADSVVGTITITVTPGVASVDVKVDTVDGPINKNTGDSVAVSWTSANATSCTCQCQDKNKNAINCGSYDFLDNDKKSFCGSGLIVEQTNPIKISGILQPTVFNVKCEP